MAEGLARELGKRKLKAFSAGLEATKVSPYAIKVMKEIGIDISKQRSKSLDEFKDEKFDYIISLCSEAEDACPILPGEGKRLHWPFLNPEQTEGSEEEILDAFRAIRDAIKAKLEDFLSKH